MRQGARIPRIVALAMVALVPLAVVAQPAMQATTSPDTGARAWTIPDDRAIDRLLAERLRDDGVGIVVGVIDPDGTRRVIAHGKSGARGVTLDGDTEFLIGSVTKVFTTLLLAEMAERGEVSLDDALADYLPARGLQRDGERAITLRDLATHASGLPSMPDNFDLSAKPDPYAAYTTAQLDAFLATHVPARGPGKAASYSNLGVFLLGNALAARAKQEYAALLKARVLDPLGMRDTAIVLTRAQLKRLAPGHDRYRQPVGTWEMTVMPGSGSLRSTVDDMLVFVAAYLDAPKHDTPLARAMTRQWQVRSPLAASQALGWGISRVGQREIVGHRGGKEGYRSAVVFDPVARTGVVVLANVRSDDEPGDLAMHLLTGKPMPPATRAPSPRPRFAMPLAQARAYNGRYRFDDDGRIATVVGRDGWLAIETAPGSGVSSFLPYERHAFYLNTGNDELTFEVDAAGLVTGLVLHGDGKAAATGHRAATKLATSTEG